MTLTVLGCLFAACGSEDGPSFSPVEWEGNWVATEMSAQPLPVCYATIPEPRCVESVSLQLDRERTGRRSVLYRDSAGVGSSLTTTLQWTLVAEHANKTGVVLEITDDRGCTYEAQTDNVPTEALFMAVSHREPSCYDDLASAAVFRRP